MKNGTPRKKTPMTGLALSILLLFSLLLELLNWYILPKLLFICASAFIMAPLLSDIVRYLRFGHRADTSKLLLNTVKTRLGDRKFCYLKSRKYALEICHYVPGIFSLAVMEAHDLATMNEASKFMVRRYLFMSLYRQTLKRVDVVDEPFGRREQEGKLSKRDRIRLSAQGAYDPEEEELRELLQELNDSQELILPHES